MKTLQKGITAAFPPGAFRLLAHMHPHIRISPFTPQEWEKLLAAKVSAASRIVEKPNFWLDGAKDIRFFKNGRDALLGCLLQLQLKSEDEVLIIKTTDGPYVSSCVTQTIEKVCRWSIAPISQPRLVLVIHEFGFPCPEEKIKIYRDRGIPILEDCAYAVGSRVEGAKVGTFGDYALYSLPKYFPIPFGGILIAKSKSKIEREELRISFEEQRLLLKTLRAAYPNMRKWNKIRWENWDYFAKILFLHGLFPYFTLKPKIIPGVFLAKVPAEFAGETVKIKLNTAGVESTQYYNQGGFYFPVHHNLTPWEKQYIVQYFFERNPQDS